MQRAVPQLRITNYERSCAFWIDGLGFTIDWEHRFEPGFPVFMQVSRGGLALFLTEHSGEGATGGAVYLFVDDVDAYYREITSRGVKPDSEPADTEWHSREFVVYDPDRNRVRIGASRASAP